MIITSTLVIKEVKGEYSNSNTVPSGSGCDYRAHEVAA